MKTFNVEFLGCKVNAYEIQALREGFLGLGLKEQSLDRGADLYVLNTCAVTANAGSTSRNRVRRALRRNPGARILLTGCYVEEDRGRLEGMRGVHRVFGNDEKETIVPFVARQLLGKVVPERPFTITRMSGQTRAFVKIEDGCDDNCTFCIIPTLRGPARSRNPDEICHEVGELVRSGHKEIVLTGVHIGYFGHGDGPRGAALIDLLSRLRRVPGLARLKLSSIEVHELTDELLDLFRADPVFAPHFHVPLQSGCDRTLRRMRRKYNRRVFENRILALRRAVAEPALSTDVIVGFPGETDADFDETLAFCRSLGFMKIHVFPYSRREGTEAARDPDPVPAATIEARKHALLEVDRELGDAWREGFVGRTVFVLVEGRRDQESPWLTGLTERYLRVDFEGPDRLQGEIVPARVVGVTEGAVLATREGPDPS
jgi:threonylcarbamoyladenosine tRNA methylthiotransferase MtaB